MNLYKTGRSRYGSGGFGKLRLAVPIKSAVQFRADQDAECADVKPDQRGDAGAKGPVEHRVIRKSGDIPAEGERGRKPDECGCEGAGKHPQPMFRAFGAEVVERGEDGGAGDECERPA